jgi:hypothetical protein
VKNWEFSVRTIACLAATAVLLCARFGFALAQNTPDSGAPAAPATAPSTAATPATAAPVPAAETQPANAPAPAAQSATSPAANPPSANAPAAADSTPNDSTAKDITQKTKKKKATGITRRHEIEKSIESGTVPSRYRSSVPKEYQQYIPFSKD